MTLIDEVKEFIDLDKSRAERIFHEDFSSDEFTAKCLTIECVEAYGGEGGGETYYSVYSFEKDAETVYLKFDGWYQSYHGSEFESYFEVTPVEKTITIYKSVKG